MQSGSRWCWHRHRRPGSSVFPPAPRAGSSPGLAPHGAGVAATAPAVSGRFWERRKGLVMSHWPEPPHVLIPDRHSATAGNDSGGSQLSDTNGCRELDVRGALLIRKKAEQKQRLGRRSAPDCFSERHESHGLYLPRRS